MKKLLTLILIGILAFGLVSCGSGSGSNAKIGDVKITVPEGMVESSETKDKEASTKRVWQTADPTTDPTNIVYMMNEEKVTGFDDMNEKEYEKLLKEQYKTANYAVDDIEFKEFDKTKVDGFDAWKIKMAYSLNGLNLTQLQILIKGDKMATYTFTTVGENDWMDKFEKAVKTIDVIEAK